jgi:hypothetical protein
MMASAGEHLTVEPLRRDEEARGHSARLGVLREWNPDECGGNVDRPEHHPKMGGVVTCITVIYYNVLDGDFYGGDAGSFVYCDCISCPRGVGVLSNDDKYFGWSS